jgi:rod shape-determining protein MreD
MNKLLPSLTILVAVLATAVPWGLPADATFVLPLVVVMMVFCWRAIEGAYLPPIAVVLLGLLTDVTTGGPLGYWGLIALLVSSIAWRTQFITDRWGSGVLWLVWVVAVSVLAGFGWLLASLYFFRWVDWRPILIGAAASAVLFPHVMSLLLRIRRARLAPRRSAAYGGAA